MGSQTKNRARKRRTQTAPPPRRSTSARPRPVVAPKRRTPPSRLARLGLTTSPRRLYACALGIAVVLGSLLIGLSVMSANRSATVASTNGGVAVTGTAETAALFQDLPQQGNRLGSPAAPLELVEYADPQCPYCAAYALDVMPTLIREYVRTGRVQMVFRGLWFLGPDSGTALRSAAAVAPQNRFWNVLDLIYRNQGAENAWVSEELMRSIVTAAGADAPRAVAARDSAGVTTMIDGWEKLAQADGINAVPTFYLGPRGGPLERLQLSGLTAAEFRAALDNALER